MFKNIENFLTFVTGVIIFLPVCFVDKTIHAILMGVTMHYTQYLVLTYKICKNFKPSDKNLKYLITDSRGKILKNSHDLVILIKKTNWKKL